MEDKKPIITDWEEFENYFRIDMYNAEKTKVLKEAYETILKHVGEDISRDGLIKTPERAAKSIQFLTHGYHLNAIEIIKSALFDVDYSQMVLVKNIEVFSLCEHHILPFIGKAHVAYIPNGKVVGLSKIARVVDAYARRLQVQERLTNQIKDCLQETLQPLGVGVVIECAHLCMQMRGVQKQHSITTTSAFSGVFLEEATRKEFISLIKD
ncbi:MAG TPA: GTP cyclohydrolase I FolE [Bacteroidia bacterium]|jgi:GTP cyclohydrolase I|nr:GTP cyclohydrolase I FolE [Bacteroidia bacterium]